MATSSRWSRYAATKYSLVVLWLSGCGVLFWRTYRYYKYEPSFYYVHQILGSCLCLSRASAAVLNLTCGMAVLPVCRVTVTTLRHFNAKMKLRTMRMLLDCCKGFHICCAYLIVGTSMVHFSAHMWNARNFSMYYNHVIRDVNAALYQDQDPLWILLQTVPGVTGFLMMILLSLIVSSSVTNIRNVNYDLFWYCHRLFVLFYVLLLVHALKGPIRKQINVNSHTPGCPIKNITSGNMTLLPETRQEPIPEAEYNFGTACDDNPRFTQIGCYSWLWVSGPLLVYVCDTVYRFTRRLTQVKLVAVKNHPCDVVELQLERPGFAAKPGQFILLQCPRISTFEWHPFSLTMCPVSERPSFSVHIRARGDWSEKLRKLLLNSHDRLENEAVENMRHCLRVDGPFCSPMEDVRKYRVLLCIAGGIGVTPFISLLTAIRDSKKWTRKLHRVCLVWMCREYESFGCFQELIESCHAQCWQDNRPDLFDIRFHCTGHALTRHQNDFVKKRLCHGRPNWKDIFSHMKTIHKRFDTGVFCCGPRGLVTDVKYWCHELSSQPNRFFFYHESY
ncbi:NADPH oxidase 4-like [Liolophura sinensis]|uniref:NADPH oxidase 4-like n=1 Tax=Liolophura sinensis TaxID=3198878 RepID=UPI003158F895